MTANLPKTLLGCQTFDQAIELLTMMEEMRQEEGTFITVFCDNPDFGGGPNSAVEVSSGFAEFPHRFTGETFLEAMRSAYAAWKGRL